MIPNGINMNWCILLVIVKIIIAIIIIDAEWHQCELGNFTNNSDNNYNYNKQWFQMAFIWIGALY